MLQHQRLSPYPVQLHAQRLGGRLHRGRKHPLPGVVYGPQGLRSLGLRDGDLHAREGERRACPLHCHTCQGPRLHLPRSRHLHQRALPLHRANTHRDRAGPLVLGQPPGGAKQASLLHQGHRVFRTLDLEKHHAAAIRRHLDRVGKDVQGRDGAGVKGPRQGRT
jgi:hypothetical protein